MKIKKPQWTAVNKLLLQEDILKLHILYLEKMEYLSKEERTAYEKYFTYLSNPLIVVSNESGDISEGI